MYVINFYKVIYFKIFINESSSWKMGIGDWGLGIGDWGLGIGPNPQSPIPNPPSPIPFSKLMSFLSISIIIILKNEIYYNEIIFIFKNIKSNKIMFQRISYLFSSYKHIKMKERFLFFF